jgi:hypothetical protein
MATISFQIFAAILEEGAAVPPSEMFMNIVIGE